MTRHKFAPSYLRRYSVQLKFLLRIEHFCIRITFARASGQVQHHMLDNELCTQCPLRGVSKLFLTNQAWWQDERKPAKERGGSQNKKRSTCGCPGQSTAHLVIPQQHLERSARSNRLSFTRVGME